jgi:hypothetical protein
LDQLPGRSIKKLDTHRLAILAITDDHTTGLLDGIYRRIIA